MRLLDKISGSDPIKNGKQVTIVDGNGKTLVKGSSKYKVKVTGNYSTTVKITKTNKIVNATINRSNFDKYYGTDTTIK
ncbi:hypothetical protein B7R82_10415 (plasmid) [Ligilactobacillus salivarius]|uniref:Uncharacterized protein n=1 Tax=Ligilactobacillus salivarius TaxID=1624 RepID=A0A1Y0FAI0_9LACO|nr:hypothetical protein B7R82_10415 [Ligilactobacillus salivarius]